MNVYTKEYKGGEEGGKRRGGNTSNLGECVFFVNGMWMKEREETQKEDKKKKKAGKRRKILNSATGARIFPLARQTGGGASNQIRSSDIRFFFLFIEGDFFLW